MNTRSFAPVIALIGGLLLLGGCQQSLPKDAVATYSHTSGSYSEEFVLRASGQYQQTVIQTSFPKMPSGVLYEHTPSSIVSPQPPNAETCTGAWRLLDKPDGKPLPLPSSLKRLPPAAVVELKDALPFDVLTDDRPLPPHLDRTLPARSFTLKLP